MIHIVDYGLGNIQALMTVFKRLGVESTLAHSAEDLRGAKKLILPGVGAFDQAIELLNASGMRSSLEDLVNSDGVPVLGICVGMQMLANGSDEGIRKGLSWIDGRVCSFASNPPSADLPTPHMGWNDVVATSGSPLFKGLENGARFYFLHSYFFECRNTEHSSARTEYGFQFDCAVQKGNIFGVQFHPEKSHHWGAALLKNFADL
jgi:glutamine amidotransferase